MKILKITPQSISDKMIDPESEKNKKIVRGVVSENGNDINISIEVEKRDGTYYAKITYDQKNRGRYFEVTPKFFTTIYDFEERDIGVFHDLSETVLKD